MIQIIFSVFFVCCIHPVLTGSKTWYMLFFNHISFCIPLHCHFANRKIIHLLQQGFLEFFRYNPRTISLPPLVPRLYTCVDTPKFSKVRTDIFQRRFNAVNGQCNDRVIKIREREITDRPGRFTYEFADSDRRIPVPFRQLVWLL